jgi:hypothetical protein
VKITRHESWLQELGVDEIFVGSLRTVRSGAESIDEFSVGAHEITYGVVPGTVEVDGAPHEWRFC